MGKIIQSQQLPSLTGKLKKSNARTVLVGGCFDLLHPGHVYFLETAKKLGDVLIVLLESDQSVAKRKGPGRPINRQQHRAKMLSAFWSVDYTVKLPELDDQGYDSLVNQISPQVIATIKGDPHLSHKKRQAILTGAQLKLINPLKDTHSTTSLIRTLSALL